MNYIQQFELTYKKPPAATSFCPYRICPIGAHMDHQHGLITGLAIDKGVHIAYGPKQNGVVELSSLQFDRRAQWHIAQVPEKPTGDWADYPQICPHFDEWAKTKAQKITVVDDGTSTNETRLGAVKDIQFAIEKLGLDDDMVVISGDNVLDFSLTKFIRYAQEKDTSCVMRYHEPSEKKLQKCGVALVDENDLILSLEEKPAEPKSHWATPPFYFYTQKDAQLVKVGIEQGCGTDAPGSYIAWLCTQTPVHSMEMPGSRYDIGNLESYQQVQETYKGITK